MSLYELRKRLQFISTQTKDTAIVSGNGACIFTQRHLLSTVSPYLATLLCQVDQQQNVTFFVPFDTKDIRSVLDSLVEGVDEFEIDSEGYKVAQELGILFLKQNCTKPEKVDELEGFDFDPIRSDLYIKNESSSLCVNSDILCYKTKTKELKLEDKEYKCNTCDMKFEDLKNLNAHDKKIHLDIRKLSCDQCGKHFPKTGDLNRHIDSVHIDEKRFLCDHCGRGFNTAGNRNTHVENIHTEGPDLQCPHCEKTVKYLKEHIKHVHTNSDEKYTCEECGKVFRTKKCVTRHRVCHLPDDIKKMLSLQAKDKYRCSSCGIGFIDMTRLRWHEAAKHTGIKSYQCKICPKSYFRSDHLKTHVINSHEQ